MIKIFQLLEDLADTDASVLITGASGTGKELVAQALHYNSNRSEKPLVSVNCSALSESLLESELFGHVKGAFTNALHDKVGRFQLADGGTLFLDEIGDISPLIQLKLLRVLQEHKFERVGESNTIGVDVRVIVATHQDLKKLVAAGRFREDLYYRVKVVEIALPSLAEKCEDIPILTGHFLERFNKKYKKQIKGISPEVLEKFMRHPWPGNIRELEHAIEHAFVLCRDQTITLNHLPPDLTGTLPPKPSKADVKPQNELEKINAALEQVDWNKAKAARLLGVSRQTLYRKVEEYGITRSAR
jgi:two-component system, NtrC family, response regulator HydG